MRFAAASALQMAVALGGVITLALAGVKLHVDREMERYFIEVEPHHEPASLKIISDAADALGLEVMPEWECPPEVLGNGAIRHWLAEKEVLDDCCLSKAV